MEIVWAYVKDVVVVMGKNNKFEGAFVIGSVVLRGFGDSSAMCEGEKDVKNALSSFVLEECRFYIINHIKIKE